jgi:hypothetical protein
MLFKEKISLYTSVSQTFYAEGTLKLCNIIAGNPLFSPPMIYASYLL